MSTSWGIDPLKDANGVVTLGTSSADLRQIQGGLYSPGLISGGLVTRSASALTYTVSPGVAAFPIVTGATPQTVLGAIPSKSLTTTAPSSGSRLDMIIAEQRTVATDGDPNIDVRIATSLPPRAVLLDAYLVSSTTANTNSAVRQADIKYSVPYGASMGAIFWKRSTFSGNFTVAANDIIGSFYLPTDRLLTVSLTATLSAYGAIRFDDTKYCETGYDIYIDEIKRWGWTSPGLHQATAEYHWSDVINIAAGAHTVRTVRHRAAGPGTPVASAALLSLTDNGPIV